MRHALLRDTAADIASLGATLQADLLAWAYAAIGIALVAAGFLWVRRMMTID